MKSGVVKVEDNVLKFRKRLNALTEKAVYVGVPASKAPRQDDIMNNATLAYIHDKGSPAANIPARPFMQPGIEAVRDRINNLLKKGAAGALHGDTEAVDRAFNQAGLIAQASIRGKINEGIPPPLATSTLMGRISAGTSVQGAKDELARRLKGDAPSTEYAKPLIATGQLRNSISYVIR